MHVHTNYSPCSIIPLHDLLILAGSLNLDAVVITDHDTLKGALKAKSIADGYGLTVLVGCEISAREGQILAYGISEEIPPNLPAEETLELIHSQGGVGIAAHPYRENVPSLGELVYNLKLDGVEVSNKSIYNLDPQAIRAAKVLGIAMIGGSDAHVLRDVGWCVTVVDSEIESEDDLVKIIRNKACYPRVLR